MKRVVVCLKKKATRTKRKKLSSQAVASMLLHLTNHASSNKKALKGLAKVTERWTCLILITIPQTTRSKVLVFQTFSTVKATVMMALVVFSRTAYLFNNLNNHSKHLLSKPLISKTCIRCIMPTLLLMLTATSMLATKCKTNQSNHLFQMWLEWWEITTRCNSNRCSSSNRWIWCKGLTMEACSNKITTSSNNSILSAIMPEAWAKTIMHSTIITWEACNNQTNRSSPTLHLHQTRTISCSHHHQCHRTTPLEIQIITPIIRSVTFSQQASSRRQMSLRTA